MSITFYTFRVPLAPQLVTLFGIKLQLYSWHPHVWPKAIS
jgi:hypothetical protein